MKLARNCSLHSLVLSALLIAPLACADQKPADVDQIPTPEERATLVEGRILTSVQVEGRPEAAFTLEERMEFYGVPGASVAVLNDGTIEWARGYGLKDVATGEPPARLVRTGPDTFVAVETDLEIQVGWGPDGRAMWLEGQGIRVVRVEEE